MADDDFFNLEKSAEAIIERRGLRGSHARVGNALDVSGSKRRLYETGVMQRYLNRGLALALKLDDDGVLDTWAFDDEIRQLPSVTRENYQGYVERDIMPRSDIWGSTRYVPPLRAAETHWFAGTKPGLLGRLFGRKSTSDQSPALLLFWTDGNNDPGEDSSGEVDRVLQEIAKYPLYVAFIGVGNESFRVIRQAADDYENVGCLIIPNSEIATISDDALYDRLVTDEMAKWLRATGG